LEEAMMHVARPIFALVAAIGVFQSGPVFAAEAYPTHTVTIVEPTPPGGGADIAARLLAQKISEQQPQKFIVENKAGAGGILGARSVADSKPDGYTLLFAASAMTIAPYLLPDLQIDVEKELSPIAEVAAGALVVVVNPAIPANNIEELVAYIKDHGDTFRWGGTLGSPDYFSIVQINMMAGLDAPIIPFNGAGPTLASLLGSEISAAVIVPTLVKDLVKAGKLKALAVTSKEPTDLIPGVPPVASSGPRFASFDSALWYGLWGPKGMPKTLTMQIQQMVAKAMAEPELREKYKTAGMFVKEIGTPDEFATFVSSEVKKNKSIIDAGQLRSK
jgi:tripartite-type tricarboxylate transporter receptor subunit TctC